MSKYYKAEDVIAFLNLHCPKDMWEYQIAALPTIDIVTCEECKHNDCERILAMSTCYGEIEEHAELNSCSHGERIEEL